MKTTLLYTAAFLFATASSAVGQTMSALQYQDYLNRLDVASARWQRQIKSVDIEQLSVDYSTGKSMEKARDITLANLEILRGLLKKQRSTDLLSLDAGIEEIMGDASNPLSTLLFILPSNQQASRIQQSLSPVQTEMADLQLELRKHIDAYADKL
jgi:hypothetical protein